MCTKQKKRTQLNGLSHPSVLSSTHWPTLAPWLWCICGTFFFIASIPAAASRQNRKHMPVQCLHYKDSVRQEELLSFQKAQWSQSRIRLFSHSWAKCLITFMSLGVSVREKDIYGSLALGSKVCRAVRCQRQACWAACRDWQNCQSCWSQTVFSLCWMLHKSHTSDPLFIVSQRMTFLWLHFEILYSSVKIPTNLFLLSYTQCTNHLFMHTCCSLCLMLGVQSKHIYTHTKENEMKAWSNVVHSLWMPGSYNISFT